FIVCHGDGEAAAGGIAMNVGDGHVDGVGTDGDDVRAGDDRGAFLVNDGVHGAVVGRCCREGDTGRAKARVVVDGDIGRNVDRWHFIVGHGDGEAAAGGVAVNVGNGHVHGVGTDGEDVRAGNDRGAFLVNDGVDGAVVGRA